MTILIPYEIDRGVRLTGFSTPMKVYKGDRVKIPAPSLSNLIILRHGLPSAAHFHKCLMYGKRAEENTQGKICTLTDIVEDEEAPLYKKIKITRGAGVFRLPANPNDAKWVRFFGRGDAIDIFTSEPRTHNRRIN